MSRSGRLASACLALAILGTALPAAANAAFTSSNVAAPADPFTSIADLRGGAISTITVSGTVTGQSPGDMGQLICDFSGTSFDTVGGTVDVSSGSFSIPVPANEVAGKNCVLRMVNQGFTGAEDRTGFTGPSAYGGTFNDSRFSGSPNNGVLTDAWTILAPGTLGSNIYLYSMGSCGIGIAPPLGTGPLHADFAWDCVGYYYRTDEGTTPTSSEAKVDTHTAYVPGMGGSATNAEGAPGLAPVDFRPSYNPATGVLTVDETGVVQRCSGSDAPDPVAATCASKVDTGVRVTRHWVTGTDGISATLTETWSVADGGTHQISLIPEADGDSTHSRFDFPWLGNGYVQYTGDPSLPGPGAGSAPVSLFTVSDDPGAASPTLSYGSLTTNVPPDSIPFYGVSPGTGNEYPQIAYARTITPSQPFSYTWKLATGRTDAGVRARAAADADSLASPVVKITAPANGSKTKSAKATVTGTATDNGGVSSFTVNGTTVALGAGGAFSTSVPLKVGANTIVAQASDKTGNTTKASVALTRIRQCVVPHLKGKKVSRARRALRKAHCKLGKVNKAYRTHLTGKRGHRTRVPFKTGRIIAQRPHAGAKKKAGTKVNVVVQKATP
jgi:hypothetical protein